jgi:predicted nucleotidyltransferase
MPSNFIKENQMLIEQVAAAFDDLLDHVVFLGGVTTSLLVDHAAVGAVRKTEDVDVIADLVSRPDYYAFCEKLRAKGFREDRTDDAPLCRWIVSKGGVDYIVDVMPCDESILGFANRWYPEAIKAPDRVALSNGIEINVVTPLLFLATKFEAFHGRASGNYFSKDMEDIVFILEHRSSLMNEFLDGSENIRAYIGRQAAMLLQSEFRNVLPGLVDDDGSFKSVYRLLELMAKHGGQNSGHL